jgi:integrase
MGRTRDRLNFKTVTNAPLGMHCDGGGLYLQVTAAEDGTLNRSWIFRFARSDGRERKMGLGSVRDVSLAEAREKAAECQRLRKQGVDPIMRRNYERAAAIADAQVEAAKTITFQKAAEAYIASHRDGWENVRHAAQWKTTLETFAYPVFGKLPVSAIDTGLVMRVLEPAWKTTPETASRVRGRIESVLDWAKVRGYREGENPARWRGHLDHLLPKKAKVRKVEHHPALPHDEIGAFMSDLRAQEGIVARALEFAILTAARTGEVRGARWGEFNFEARTWTVPGSRMKAGKEHRVPLSSRAMAIVEAMHAIRTGDLAFPGYHPEKPLSAGAMLVHLKDAMGRADLTVHGFRSTFRDWAAESTSFPGAVVEMALAHGIGDAVEKAYRRGDLFEKRRLLMDAWDVECSTTHPARGEVVSINSRKAR